MIYYIYHIPGKKIGCTENPKERVTYQQKYHVYEILEEHTCIYKASKRDQELQKQYGYAVDTVPYFMSVQNIAKGRQNVTHEHRVNAGKARGKQFTKEYQSKVGKLGGEANRKLASKFTYEQAEEIRERVKSGSISNRGLARELGVSATLINNIVNYKTYKTK